MKKTLLLSFIFLSGCQVIQNSLQCSDFVNQQVPAQTQQRYVRTDTQCNTQDAIATTTKGSQYLGSSQTNCSSKPIYETIILNQAERNVVHQQCMNNYRAQQNNSYTTNTQIYSTPFEPNANWTTNNLCGYAKRNDVNTQPAINELRRRGATCN